MEKEIKIPALVSAKYMNEQYPETFDIPTKEELSKLVAGNIVRVCACRERFWVKITKIHEGGKFIGEVDNDLVLTNEHDLRNGDKIAFHVSNIYSVFKF